MSDDLAGRVRTVALRFALENAVRHGSANASAVIGKVLGAAPDLRPHAKDVPAIVASLVGEVNAMPSEQRAIAFAAIAGELSAGRRKEEARGPLKPLPNASKGRVVLRLAPNPSGPPHFGHGRGFVINWTYKEMYDAKFVLRFDDTDTTVKPPWPPAYEMFIETCEWLCGKPDRVIRASEHVERYYAVAEEALRRGGLYVCECEGDVFRAFKERAEPCPHRNRSATENLGRWIRMMDGSFRRGEAVVRVKTDVAHRDPALRDWVALRIAEEPHPLVGDRYRVWPLLDFQSAVDDHDEGVTHIIRGKDLRDSTAKQEFLYAHLGWTYPETLYWGRVSVHEFGKFSKSILHEAIRRGEYTGWDDPRLPTFPALRRRGFRAEAIRKFWISFGITEKDIAASAVTLEAENRKIVEPVANRYFYVADPVDLRIEGAPDDLTARAPRHPDHPERGERVHHLRAGPSGHVVLVAKADFEEAQLATAGARVRLKDLVNVEAVGSAGADQEEPVHAGCARFAGNSLDFLRQPGVRIIQWVPRDGLAVTLLLPDGSIQHGAAERELLDEPVDAVIQLERVGFARVEARSSDSVKLVFAHR